jgi:hypothetical protein
MLSTEIYGSLKIINYTKQSKTCRLADEYKMNGGRVEF